VLLELRRNPYVHFGRAVRGVMPRRRCPLWNDPPFFPIRQRRIRDVVFFFLVSTFAFFVSSFGPPKNYFVFSHLTSEAPEGFCLRLLQRSLDEGRRVVPAGELPALPSLRTWGRSCGSPLRGRCRSHRPARMSGSLRSALLFPRRHIE